MSILYIITNTFGDNLFTIKPGALNGPGGIDTDSDLRLYGQGSTVYGEGVNENLYRLTENFACPEKAGTPGTPQDESDLGPGNGINNPINGQPWYNTTTKQLMIYDSVGGQFASSGGTVVDATPPASPIEGDLWYDTTVPQLKVYDSVAVAFISVATKYLLLDGTVPMTGSLNLNTVNNIINLAEPVNPQDAATMNYVDTEISTITGGGLDALYLTATVDDTMEANLTFASAKTLKFGAVPTMTLNVGNGVVSNGADVLFANAGLLAANANIHVHVAATGTGSFIVSQGSTTVGAQTDLLTVEKTGEIKANTASYESLVLTDDVLTNKKYVDDAVTAGNVYVPLTLFNVATTTYTLQLINAGNYVNFSSNSPITLTVPPNSSVAFAIGTEILITQNGTGVITMAPGSGVGLNSPDGLLTLNTQYSSASLIYKGSDSWTLIGDFV